MNWKRGIYRLYAAFTGFWVLYCGFWIIYDPRPMVQVQAVAFMIAVPVILIAALQTLFWVLSGFRKDVSVSHASPAAPAAEH